MTATPVVVPPHPAKFSDAILDVLRPLLAPYEDLPTIDPMAGVGRIFEVAPWAVGLEIEEDWAKADPRIVAGDLLNTPPAIRGWRYWCAVTSCTYGNRMADHHDAKEKCRPCGGKGVVPVTAEDDLVMGHAPCSKCEGKGHRTYKRLTYKHQIGHDLHPNNSGAMPWGPGYREFHEAAWTVVLNDLMDDDLDQAGNSRVPRPVFILNVKDHWKTVPATKTRPKEVVRQEVTAWHVETIEGLGWVLDESASVDVLVPGMRFGANRDVREDYESVLVFHRG